MSSCLLRRQLQADSTASGHTLLILLKELLGTTKRRLLRHERASTPAQQEKSAQFSVPVQASSQASVHTSSAGEVCSVLGASSGFIPGHWQGEWLEPHEQRQSVPLLSRESSSQLEAGAQGSSISHRGRWGRRTPSPETAGFTNSIWGTRLFSKRLFYLPQRLPPVYMLSSVRTVEKQVS